MQDVEVVGQTDREGYLKLGTFLEAAEDNPYSGIREQDVADIRYMCTVFVLQFVIPVIAFHGWLKMLMTYHFKLAKY